MKKGMEMEFKTIIGLILATATVFFILFVLFPMVTGRSNFAIDWLANVGWA